MCGDLFTMNRYAIGLQQQETVVRNYELERTGHVKITLPPLLEYVALTTPGLRKPLGSYIAEHGQSTVDARRDFAIWLDCAIATAGTSHRSFSVSRTSALRGTSVAV